ncbi:MAG: phosphatase PAP2 family protein [Solirubrobacterales bacterium]
MLADADNRLLRAMRTRGHSPGVERSMRALGALGEWGAVWIATSSALAAADRERRKQWFATASIAPLAIGLNYAAKLAVRRPRPRLRGLPRLGPAPSELSFPSAHATSSFAAAAAIGRVAPRLQAPAYLTAIAISTTRPYLGLHYPSDVVAGAVLGIALGRVWPLPRDEEPDIPAMAELARETLGEPIATTPGAETNGNRAKG